MSLNRRTGRPGTGRQVRTDRLTATDDAAGAPEAELPIEEIARIFKALGHPTRLRLACGLCRESSSLTRIHGMLGESISTLAQHIAVLRRCGILVEERRGPEIFLRVSDARVRRFLKVLCPANVAEPPPEWAWERLRSRGN